MCLEAEKAPIIFGIADQYERIAPHRVCSGNHVFHHGPSDASTLQVRLDGDRSYQHQGDRAIQCYWPALQRADQKTFVIKRHIGKLGESSHSVPDPVSRPSPSIRTKHLI